MESDPRKWTSYILPIKEKYYSDAYFYNEYNIL